MRHIIRAQVLLCTCLLILTTCAFSQTHSITGRIVNGSDQLAVPDADIFLVKSRARTISQSDGFFRITSQFSNDTLLIQRSGFATIRIPAGVSPMRIEMKAQGELDEVVVQTGYQTIRKQQTTGSYTTVSNELINRRISFNILDRLEGVASGAQFSSGTTATQRNLNQPTISIRGRSTISSNASPLIVVDNFPYDGDLASINPNDVETITLLKDAASAAIWGAFSGNGVIVITTKKGKIGQPLKVSVNSNITIGERPDQFYMPQLSVSDYIEVERFLFSKGAYASLFSNINRPVISPVVEILQKNATGGITNAETEAQIEAYRKGDIRNDIDRYLYRSSILQQNSVSLSGGATAHQYHFSVGYDKQAQAVRKNDVQRFTLTARNVFSLISNRLRVSTLATLTQSQNRNNGLPTVPGTIPYLALTDDAGNTLAVPRQYRTAYIDTAGKGRLLDWYYRPLDELSLNDQLSLNTDYRVNLAVDYTILPKLEASLQYQYARGTNEQRNYQNESSFFTRDMINKYTQLNQTTGAATYRVPIGGILDRMQSFYESNNIRGQLSYQLSIGADHTFSALAGTELRKVNSFAYSNRLYGYDDDVATFSPVDMVNVYPLYYNNSNSQIPSNVSNTGTRNHYLSWFTNVAYVFKNRLTATASIRRDESNLFGVSANMKGVPLYSAGLGWEISREGFFRVPQISLLKLRVSYGYQGNVNTGLSSVATISYGGTNPFGGQVAGISNPPNPSLRWEKVGIINAGADFSLFSGKLSGSIDRFIKKGSDLMGVSPLDPTTGISTYTGNTANVTTTGWDIVLKGHFGKSGLQWNGTLLFNYSQDKITRYLTPTPNLTYLTSSVLNPVEGYPLYAIYSFPWAGLDNAGNPQGLINGSPSKVYASLYTLSNLSYNGPAVAPFSGSLRNTFDWGGWSLSFMFTYRMGHYFRSQSVNYTSLFNVNGIGGHPDYQLRWQQPGDEAKTHVPSLIYPNNVTNRDAFYTYSSVLVEKADFIRLQDLRVQYTLPKRTAAILHLKSLSFYGYANNLGLLWKANKKGIDPDFLTAAPNPRSYAIGVTVDF